MTGDCHARICEGLRGKLPRSTRLKHTYHVYKKSRDIVFQKGQIIFSWFALLHFYGFYDICNHHEVTSVCCFGKITQSFGSD